MINRPQRIAYLFGARYEKNFHANFVLWGGRSLYSVSTGYLLVLVMRYHVSAFLPLACFLTSRHAGCPASSVVTVLSVPIDFLYVVITESKRRHKFQVVATLLLTVSSHRAASFSNQRTILTYSYA